LTEGILSKKERASDIYGQHLHANIAEQKAKGKRETPRDFVG
jgi:hypothetical protein